jgi:putative ABC transport system ATP-binding protein
MQRFDEPPIAPSDDSRRCARLAGSGFRFPNAMSLIQLQDIRKTYTLGEVELHALDGVSLSIDRGEYVALMGPSGSGKSTLMNTLGCLDRPTSGSYLLEGEEVVTMSQDQRARLRNSRIGFVFQNFNLLSRTTALENVELPMLYAGRLSSRRRHEHAKSILDRVGLGDRLDHHPSQLSGGQQQRVAIARAMANEPSILLADEPTGNLDSRTSREVMELFRQLNINDGITVILVTHDQDIARNAKRTIVIRDGQVVSDSTDFRHAVAALHGSESVV